MPKQYDIVAKTGSYTDSQGNAKSRYQTVGALMTDASGRQYILLDAWFNPAALERQEGRSSVILSLFEPKQQDNPF